MTVAYRVDLHTASGVKVAEITNFTALSYSKRVNAPGMLQLQLNGDHSDISKFARNGQMIVYRSLDDGVTWSGEFYALHQYTRQYTTAAGINIFISRAPGIMNMLYWRENLWFAGTTNRSQFNGAKAETVMKTLVKYNATSLATTGNGRLRNGQITGISVETDLARGNTLYVNNAQDNLLESLQKIAQVAGGDFDLVKTGAQAFEFRYYPGQRGTDRTTTLTFSLENGNMTEPEYVLDYTDTKTVAVAMGKGEGVNRDYAVRTSTPYYASDFDIELYVDARNANKGDTNALNTAADIKLQDNVPKETVNFKVVQTDAFKYGLQYFLGDLVKAKYKGVTVTKKIAGVDVRYVRQGAQEDIDIILAPKPY